MRAVLPFAMALGLLAGPPPAIERATLAEPKAVTPEVSTEELVAILADGSVPVLDVRSPREYAIADARPAGAPAVGALPGAVQIRKGEKAALRSPWLSVTGVTECIIMDAGGAHDERTFGHPDGAAGRAGRPFGPRRVVTACRDGPGAPRASPHPRLRCSPPPTPRPSCGASAPSSGLIRA